MPRKILIAEDDAIILEILHIIFEEEGFLVETSLDKNRILNSDKNIPDIILLDLYMKGINGAEICKQLKSSKKTKDIPVIFLSAHRDIAFIAKEAGADGFIAKPFDIPDLISTVNRHIT